LGTGIEPVHDAVFVENGFFLFGNAIMSSYLLDDAAITWRAAIGNDDMIDRATNTSLSLKSDFNQ
jgi:hypothetical protein